MLYFPQDPCKFSVLSVCTVAHLQKTNCRVSELICFRQSAVYGTLKNLDFISTLPKQ